MNKRLSRFFSISFVLIVIDQISKILANAYMVEGQSKSIVNNYLYITLAKSKGKIYSTLVKYFNFNKNFVITIVLAIAILAYIAYYLSTKESVNEMQINLYALLFASIFSDNMDLITKGYVINFIDIRIAVPMVISISGIYFILAMVGLILDSFISSDK